MAKPSNIKNPTTIELHKTSRDGDSTINRRRMLTMTTAFAIATVSPVSMSANAALGSATLARADSERPDRALFEAIVEWQRGQEEQERLGDIQNRLEDLAYETEPATPAELFEALELPSGKKQPSNLENGWDEASLRGYAETGRQLQTSFEDLPNSAARIVTWYDDIAPSIKVRAVKLLKIRLNYESKVEAHWKEAKTAENKFGDQVSKQSEKMMEIVEMPVCTKGGTGSKMPDAAG